MLGGHVEEWHIPRNTTSNWVRYWSQTRTMERLSAWHQAVLAMFLGFRKLLCSCTEGMCHSSTHPANVQVHHYTWSVLPGLPCVVTASDKHWGEKAWVQGYSNPLHLSWSAPPDGICVEPPSLKVPIPPVVCLFLFDTTVHLLNHKSNIRVFECP